MFKTVVLFKNIQDVDALQRITEELVPPVHKVPGVICTDFIHLSPTQPVDVKGLDELQLIMETHFESEEVMINFFTLSETQELMVMANEFSLCEFYMYLGKGKRIYAQHGKNNKQQVIGDDYLIDE